MGSTRVIIASVISLLQPKKPSIIATIMSLETTTPSGNSYYTAALHAQVPITHRMLLTLKCSCTVEFT